jgi:hypothetical protein
MLASLAISVITRVSIVRIRDFCIASIIFAFSRLGTRPNRTASRLMPAAMHFLRRQYWHRFRLTLWIAHCWFFVHGRYWIFCWIDRRKNPLQPSQEWTP